MHRTIALACGLAALAAASAWAQAPQRPQLQTTKVEGTDNVYIFRNGNHQSIFVVTSEGVFASDPVAYGRPQGGAQYVAEIRKVTDKVYIFRNGNHQSIFVVTSEGVFASDPVAYGRPQGGAQYVAEIRKVTD